MSEVIMVIDAGHGGRDRFNQANGVVEADTTLVMAIACQKKLTRNGIGVGMTRTTDVDLDANKYGWVEWRDLKARCDFAHEVGAKYFVSIHTDGVDDPGPHGATSFCYQFGGDGERLARCIQARVVKHCDLYDRGVREANFAVLRDTKETTELSRLPQNLLGKPFYGDQSYGPAEVLAHMSYTSIPAALVEVGFHTNPVDAEKMKDRLWVIQAGEAVALGILDFLGIEDSDNKRDVTVEYFPVYFNSSTLEAVMVEGKGYMPIREVVELMKWSATGSKTPMSIAITTK